MTYHIVDRLGTDAEAGQVELAGRTYPLPCIVEDTDNIRLLLVAETVIPARVWHWAISSGVAAVVATTPELCVPEEHFTAHREENTQDRLYVLPERFWASYRADMTYLQMVNRPQAPEADCEVTVDLGTFVHLHTHSECSSLDGLSTMDEIIGAVCADGQKAVAITDHGNVAAHPALALACERAGLLGIYGMEAYFVHDRHVKEAEHRNEYYHLVLWAMNDVGLRNLWAMSTESYATGLYYKPRLDWEILERFSEGVMCSTACLRGPVAHEFLRGDNDRAVSNLLRLKEIFGDRLYMELHTNQLPDQLRVNEWTVQLSGDFEVPTVAVVDSHYAGCEDKHAHRVWLSVQTNSDVADDSALFGGDQDYHLMTEAEVRASLTYLGEDVVNEAVANTVRVAARCTAKLVGKDHNPVFSRPSKEWPDPVEHDNERLLDLFMDRWDTRCGRKGRGTERLGRGERELGMVIDKGFAGYFLIVQELVNYAKDHGVLVGPGRGSGGGSLVAYVSRITEIDPVDYDLLFERFMTEGRTALPDFDIDFPSSKKQFMLDFLADRWGVDHIATVGTHLRLKSKGIVRDVARAIKSTLPEDYWRDIDAVSQIIAEAEAGTAGLGLPWDDLWIEHEEVLKPYRDKYPELFALCDQLHGRLKTYGTHPAGVIIDPDHPLAGNLPLRNGENGMVTQFDMEALERLRFVKIDLLNLRTLDTLQKTVDLIHEQTGIWIDVYSWDEELKDPQIFEEISDGWTLGIFQIETASGTRMVKRFRPTSVKELADVITLVRPGPMRSGLTETFLRRRSGDEEVYFADPRLEQVLAKTYGTMVYQEDIMAVTMVLAGYGSDEADTVRRILGKKKIEAVAAEGNKFVSRTVSNGMDLPAAEDLWEQMAEFAKYSFGGAHAVGYSILGVWTAWFKFHYPVQFLTAALSTVKEERIPEFVEEARRMGYAIAPPDINESGPGFTSNAMTVRYGLLAVKGIGEAAVEAILTPRQDGPFASFADFLARKGGKCNAGHVKTLVHVGAFDSLVTNRRGLERRMEHDAIPGTDGCMYKTSDTRPIAWLPKLGGETETTEHELPCAYDWVAEPDVPGRTGKPTKRKSPAKKCTRACRMFRPLEPPNPEDVEPYTEADVRNIEMAMLGVYLSSTPFDRLPEELKVDLVTAQDVHSGDNGHYMLAAVIESYRTTYDRNDRKMGFLKLRTERGSLDVTVFSKRHLQYHSALVPGHMVLVAVAKNDRGQTLELLESAEEEETV